MRKMSLTLIVLTSLVSGTAAAGEYIPALGRAASQSAEMTHAEMQALIESVRMCWNPPAVAGGEVSVRFRLDKSGAVVGLLYTSGAQTTGKEADLLAAAAKRAVLRCQPYNLPAEKYETWREVIVNFTTD